MSTDVFLGFGMLLVIVVFGSIFVILQDRKESRELEEEAGE